MKKLFLALLFICAVISTYAQPSQELDVPLDGGTVILAIAGALVGFVVLRKKTGSEK